MSAHEIGEEPTFIHEGRAIYLRCVGDNGEHIGDLRIAEAVGEGYAHTLSKAANAGMAVFRDANVDAGLRNILGGEQ